MLDKIPASNYLPLNSYLHRADPRVKIICFIIYTVFIFLADNLYVFLILGLLLSISFLAGKLPAMSVIKGLRPVILFFVFTGMIMLFTVDGEKILVFGVLPISKNGLIYSIFLLTRLFYLAVLGAILTLTTTPMELTKGLEYLLKPLKKFKIPVQQITMIISIAVRFIPTIIEEAEKIRKAQIVRGSDLSSKNIIKKAKAMFPVMIPLFVGSIRRADNLAVAMESRCYMDTKRRTSMNELIIKNVDVGIVIIMGIYTGVFIFFNYLL
jgi:energy-coupling factor transport system permease protein